jgi:penicillin-binding protein 2D
MQEATVAFGLESRYSKNQILEMYLNRVFYGHNAYGIGAATKVYFGSDKKTSDLSIAQAAFLAGLINGPSYYDPQLHYDRARDRELYVLDGMVKMGKLSPADADKAAQENVEAELKFDQSFIKSKAPHFVRDYVLPQLEKLFGAQQAQQGGFVIYTTLDLDLQNLAQESVAKGVANAKLKREGINNGDMLAARPDTGEILAWVGSADFYDASIAGQVDVIQSLRQPGSSFKPYVFETALKERKITLASTLHDKPTDFGNYKPVDFDNKYMGDISARRSLLLSRNVPAVETAQIAGIDDVIKQAHAQGITSNLVPNLQTSIGGSEVTMYDHVQGYQPFANQGTLVPMMGITRITDAQDETLFDQKPGSQPNISHPMSPAEAYLITDTLKDYSHQWDLGWKRQMAGKSGTTGGSVSKRHRDAWMMAYNSDIVVGAWAGNTAPNTENGGAGKDISAFGTEVGQYILGPFINGLPGSMSNWYKRPDGIATGNGCPGDSGTGSAGGSEIFLAGTQNGLNCPPPSPTPTPSAAPTATPTPQPSTMPSPSPSPSKKPTPLPTPTLGATALPTT